MSTRRKRSDTGLDIKPIVTAKDGLLWRGKEAIMLPEADDIARHAGYQHAEEMVRALQSGKFKPLTPELYAEMKARGPLFEIRALYASISRAPHYIVQFKEHKDKPDGFYANYLTGDEFTHDWGDVWATDGFFSFHEYYLVTESNPNEMLKA